MIGALAERLSSSVSAADIVEKTDDTLTASVDAGGDVFVGHEASSSLQVRVVRHGRTGWAGGRSDRADAVAAQAVTSAVSGPAQGLMLPAPSPLPSLASPGAGVAGWSPPTLLDLARGLRDRLAGSGRRIEAWAERSVGLVRVANTRGVMVEYPRALVGVGATIPDTQTTGGMPFRVHLVEAGPPDLTRLDELAAAVDRWTRWPVLHDWDLGLVRAWLHPAAVRTLLGPVLLALNGARWCERTRWEPFELDGRLELRDDPLAPGRPGSRPICDDGVPTRALPLVRQGRPCHGIMDLATATRVGLPATGHGVRLPLGAPRAGFSNLRLEPGAADEEEMFRALGTGLIVLEMPWGPAPGRAEGVFRARCPWTFAVRDGAIVGRLAGAVLAGNAFEVLRQVGAVGRDAPWQGSWSLPPLVVDGLRLEVV